ncbi:MAG: malonyl-ACP O-methyltransferase BioC [Candidatus Margulisiibacteriota bacterium]
MPKTAKETVKRNFSRYAKTYDRYAGVQQQAAQKLIGMLPESAHQILDIGCGTGLLTKMLRGKYRSARIYALDISDEMILEAKKKVGDAEYIVADAEEFSSAAPFDLIVSNAAFQWFRDLEKALLSFKELLGPGGRMMFSIFGPLTFHELYWTLRSCLQKNIFISSKAFHGKTELAKILARVFKKTAIKEEILKEKNRSLKDLLTKIKYTGTQGQGVMGTRYLGKEALKKMEELYKEKHKGLEATYQIFFCEAQI